MTLASAQTAKTIDNAQGQRPAFETTSTTYTTTQNPTGGQYIQIGSPRHAFGLFFVVTGNGARLVTD